MTVLDEATSSLDTLTEKRIQSALSEICQGRTTLVVAHRLSTISNANLILVLKDGEVIERGNHKELLDIKDGIYREMWNQQNQ